MAGNAQRSRGGAHRIRARRRLVVTPELSICGYPAEDLLLRPAFIAACDDAVKTVARELAGLKGLHVVVGHPHGTAIRGKSVQVQQRYNAASVLCDGKVLETYAKRELPNYQVFDEYRYFTRGQGTCVFQVEGISVGLLICEDAGPEPAQWPAPRRAVLSAQARLSRGRSASAWPAGGPGPGNRLRGVCAPGGRPGRIIFDGASFAVNATAAWRRWRRLRRDLFYVQAEAGEKGVTCPVPGQQAGWRRRAWHALVLACATTRQDGFPGVLLGMSGASTRPGLAISVDALGADKVRAVMSVPSRRALVDRRGGMSRA